MILLLLIVGVPLLGGVALVYWGDYDEGLKERWTYEP